MDKYKLYQINIKNLSLWTLEEDLFIYYCICTLCAWVHGCVGVFTKDSESQTMVLCSPLLLTAYTFEAESFPELGAHTFSATLQA